MLLIILRDTGCHFLLKFLLGDALLYTAKLKSIQELLLLGKP